MRFLLPGFVLGLVCLTPTAATAQASRYELGQRLRAFETAWDSATDQPGKQRALKLVEKVTNLFFSFQLGEAGRSLDEARHTLTSDQPRSTDQQWVECLMFEPESRLLDAGTRELKLKISAFYPVKAEKPKDWSVRFRLGTEEPVNVKIEKLPVSVTLPVSELAKNRPGVDLVLKIETFIADQKTPAQTRTVGISRVVGSANGFPETRKLLDLGKEKLTKDSLELATLKDRCEFLKELAQGTITETNDPAARLWSEAQEMATPGKTPFFSADRPGDFWLSVPTDQTRTACRLFVPKGLDAKKPVPLVIALHGAGGSENLFFEGYGDGRIVKLCEKRGWLLLAPRMGLGFAGSSVPLGPIVDRLATRYPIDPKAVFVVGHSMGAAATIDAVQKFPGRFAAAAALGGGGRVRKDTAAAFETLPVFVGVGTADFARTGSKALQKALKDSGAKKVTFKEYEGIEHMVIVREALDDVMSLFDRTLAK